MTELKHRIEGRRQGGDDHISLLKDLCFYNLEKIICALYTAWGDTFCQGLCVYFYWNHLLNKLAKSNLALQNYFCQEVQYT